MSMVPSNSPDDVSDMVGGRVSPAPVTTDQVNGPIPPIGVRPTVKSWAEPATMVGSAVGSMVSSGTTVTSRLAEVDEEKGPEPRYVAEYSSGVLDPLVTVSVSDRSTVHVASPVSGSTATLSHPLIGPDGPVKATEPLLGTGSTLAVRSVVSPRGALHAATVEGRQVRGRQGSRGHRRAP